VTLHRGDVYYVVTEYGIAYCKKEYPRTDHGADLHRHPKFRPWLIEEAKRQNLIFRDQAFIPGKAGEYPEGLETHRTTNQGWRFF